MFRGSGDGGQRFAKADAVCVVRGERPAECTVTEFLVCGDGLRRAQPYGRAREEATGIVALCGTAALDADACKGNL